MKNDNESTEETDSTTELPECPNSSFKKYDPRTAPIKTDSAPNGVTRIAGAKAYAAKLNVSPNTTSSNQPRNRQTHNGRTLLVMSPAHHMGFLIYSNPSPWKPCFSSDSVKPWFQSAQCLQLDSERARTPCITSVEEVAIYRTFFVMTKLEPVVTRKLASRLPRRKRVCSPRTRLEEMAKAKPMYLPEKIASVYFPSVKMRKTAWRSMARESKPRRLEAEGSRTCRLLSY